MDKLQATMRKRKEKSKNHPKQHRSNLGQDKFWRRDVYQVEFEWMTNKKCGAGRRYGGGDGAKQMAMVRDWRGVREWQEWW